VNMVISVSKKFGNFLSSRTSGSPLRRAHLRGVCYLWNVFSASFGENVMYKCSKHSGHQMKWLFSKLLINIACKIQNFGREINTCTLLLRQ
jgi:hypothetical protein